MCQSEKTAPMSRVQEWQRLPQDLFLEQSVVEAAAPVVEASAVEAAAAVARGVVDVLTSANLAAMGDVEAMGRRT